MKSKYLKISTSVLIAVLTLSFGTVAAAVPSSRKKMWEQVEVAKKKGLPKTAIESLEPIIESAIAEKAYAEAIKALAEKIDQEGRIQGRKAEEKITRLEAARATAPEEMVPMLDAIMANWYWLYFNQNRWRFMQRTRTGSEPGKDMTTWDLPRIMNEIDKQFTRVLAASETLKKIPIGDYDDLLIKGSAPVSCRPTLYDFVAFNALAFYSSGERAVTAAEDAFVVEVDSPIFGSVKEFTEWKAVTTDPDSRIVKAIELYQDLLRFHAKDENPDARADIDLQRLALANSSATGEGKSERYKRALKAFVEEWVAHPVAARALHALATVLNGEGQKVEARRVASRGLTIHPESHGGKLCYNLVQQIESPSLNTSGERVWQQPFPTLDVSYRNLTKVHFRAVAYNWEKEMRARKGRTEQLSSEQCKRWLKEKPVRTWSVDLPATTNYHARTEYTPVPTDLPPGSYYIFASGNAEFDSKDNQVACTACWVSDLTLVTRNNQLHAPQVSGFVLDGESGEPIAEAVVTPWELPRRSKDKLKALAPVKTDTNGYFSIKKSERLVLHVTHAGHALSSARALYSYRSNPPKPRDYTTFFTDRSLYRPGQTIQYKGICYHVDKQKDDYHTLAERTFMLVFQDRNGKEIEKQECRSNAYGSFSGSFTAPRDRLMGRMSIRVHGGPSGSSSFNVEEYKRPKFRVELASPETPARLNGEVTLQGTASAYTGASINDAKVKYRVVRKVRWPEWWGRCYWWCPPRSSQSQEIAHGSTQTGADGSFKITFTAKPDPKVLEKDEPTFMYEIHADVIDATGETRSDSHSINLGYTALAATMSAPSWLTATKPVKISLQTATLDNMGQGAECTIKIHALEQPAKVQRAPLLGGHPYHRYGGSRLVAPVPDGSNVNSWPLGKLVQESMVKTDSAGKGSLEVKLEQGVYRVLLETRDRFGKMVTAQLPMQVMEPGSDKFKIRIPNHVDAPDWTLEPGDSFVALWGSGYESARVFYEIEHRGKILQSFWTEPGCTQSMIEQEVTEAMRGGFILRTTMVRQNRAYLTSRLVEVPWSNKQLELKWEHITSKLEPGAKDIWTAVISGPESEKAVAEMVAGLYDASLDAYKKHAWIERFNVFRGERSYLNTTFANSVMGFRHTKGQWQVDSRVSSFSYPDFPDSIRSVWNYSRGRDGGGGQLIGGVTYGSRHMVAKSMAAPMVADAVDSLYSLSEAAPGASKMSKGKNKRGNGGETPPAPSSDLDKVSLRRNLNETAFFFPHLVSDKDGVVRMEFTMPEALTEWKFMGFAHDAKMRSGFLSGTTVTAKDLMVQPNPPRFLRERDILEFTVKVSNQSPTIQRGSVRLSLAEAFTQRDVTKELGIETTEQSFEIPGKSSRVFSWRIKVPDDMGFLTYKAVASTGRLSDGEEGNLPVLSRRILVTESLALPIRRPGTKSFKFDKLLASAASDTLSHKLLSVQMVSQPAWYAVMALPYIMESCRENSEQVFNRLYANALGRHIAGSDPKIRSVFDQWRGTDALDSPLEKNQDLKAVILEETPWLRAGKSESQARRNVGILFDNNRLDRESRLNMEKLKQYQKSDGYWPWFPGGHGNHYITQYIMTGFGRLRHLGVKVDMQPAVKASVVLDDWLLKRYENIIKNGHKDQNNLSALIAYYLYGRSFLLEDRKIEAKHQQAFDYFLAQGRKYWLEPGSLEISPYLCRGSYRDAGFGSRQSKAHLALALKRFGDNETPQAIMKSIKEHSVINEELGMFWRDTEYGYYWYHAPIETQAMMIEAFDEIMNDQDAVEECKVWLLKQKQSCDWKNTKATADAIYGLLLRGTGVLASDKLVTVSLDGKRINSAKVEAGTGFYEKRYSGGDIKPAMGNITVTKEDEGVSWGSLHWQYVEDMTKVTPHEGTPLKVKKSLYTKVYTKSGPTLQPVRQGVLKVGDELVARIELRVDRDMEYVHLKDQRGSGTEPVNVISRYRYQDGLGYYESTRDTASHFFIDYLPKGTYVFEYSVRVQHKGEYQSGMAQVQCMYAPEFNSHSASFMLRVGAGAARVR